MTFSLVQAVLFGIVGFLYLLLKIFTILSVCYFRHKPQVKIRNLFLVIVQLGSCCIGLTCLTFVAIIDSSRTSCYVYVVLFMSILSFLAAVVLRCYLLYLTFNVSLDSVTYIRSQKILQFRISPKSPFTEKTSEQSSTKSRIGEREHDQSNSARLQRLQRNRFLFQPVTIMGLWLGLSVIFWGAFFANYFSSAVTRESVGESLSERSCGITSTSFVTVIILVFASFIGTIVLQRGFSKVRENFHLKNELQQLVLTTACLSFSLIIIEGVLGAVAGSLEANVYKLSPLRLLYYLFASFQCRAILNGIEVSQELSKRRREMKTVPSTKVSEMEERFKQILKNDQSRKLVSEFLRNEFAAENIFFYEIVEDFERTVSADLKSAQEQASSIFATFCLDNSPLCINVCSETRQKLLEMSKCNLDELDEKALKSLFEEARVEIFELMLRDTFPRFVLKHSKEIEKILNGETVFTDDDLELVNAITPEKQLPSGKQILLVR